MPDWERLVREHLPPLGMRPERETEIIAELALQLEQAYADALAGGAAETDALRQGLSQFGDWQKLAAEIRRANRPDPPLEPPPPGGYFRGIGHDVRYALRALRNNPVFAAVSVLTLAFGIGGNTAIFTMVDALVLRSLPYPQPGRLMAIETRKTQQPELEPWTSALDFFDARQQTHSFSAMAGISPIWNVVLTGRGRAERLECLFVSADLFRMLGVTPAAGRFFSPSEDQGAHPSHMVVISHALWERQFAGSETAIGQVVNLDSSPYTIIGVMPAGFRYVGEPLTGSTAQIDAWFPLADNQLTSSIRGLRFLKVVGRLRPAVSASQADSEIRRFGAALEDRFPESNRGFSWLAEPLQRQVAGPVRVTMLLLLGAVGFVLLMACANVANLLLARAAARQREITVRIALGASRSRLLRQLLTEGLVLATLGGILGLPLAWAGLRILVAAGPETLMRARSIQLDLRALAFTAAAVVAAALLASLPPAFRTLSSMGNAMREAGRGLTPGHHRIRSLLVTAQIALALVLLVGSGLLIRSFQRLLDVNPGFDARNVITISTQMPSAARTPELRAATWQLLRDRLLRQPEVAEVAAVSRLPMLGRSLGTWVFAEGKSVPGAPTADVEYRVATSSYFSTMGIPLRAGRLYDQHDDPQPGSVLVINESLARKFWPGEDAVGKRVKLGANPERQPWVTVIGVVGDIRHIGLATEPRPELYRPYMVNPLGNPILVVRTRTTSPSLAARLAETVRSVNPEIPAYDVFAMETLVERSTRERRFVMLLLSGYALAALLLAGIGIYGTISQSVAQRTAEIGLRVALGASPGTVLRLVFRQGIRMVAAGIAGGALAAGGLTWLMRTILFEVRPLDPLSFAAAAFTLAVFALLACFLPARRATRVDPLIALRHDG